MKAPSVNIAFIEKAATAIERTARGIVMMILKEETFETADYEILDTSDIPSTLSAENQAAITRVLYGYQTTPTKVLVHLIKSDAEGLDEAYKAAEDYIAAKKWNYLVVPTAQTDGKAPELSTWIKTQRTINHKSFKAVLPNVTADNDGVTNVTMGYTDSDGTELTAEQACARVAGIIVGTPFTMSCTYAPVTEALGCPAMTPEEKDEAVNAGKLIFFWDGEKVKIVRGVNSFVTTNDVKNNSFKKIKLVDAMDMISDDIRETAEDSYIGKYANSYDNKCLLISAINAYFDTLIAEGVISAGKASLDLAAIRTYIKSKGGKFVNDAGDMAELATATDEDIKKANTGSDVFLTANVSLLDAIEDITLNIYIG